MNKKVIFFDVDGTLIDRNEEIHEPTEKTRKIIQKMIDLNHYPIVATGRPMCMIKEDLLSLGFKNFLTSGGNYVVVDNKVVHSVEMDTQLLKKALDDAKKLGLALYFENNEKCFVDSQVRPRMLDFIERVGEEVFEICDDISNLIINKANLLWQSKENFDTFYNMYKDVFNFSIFAGNNGSTDIIPKGASKAVGAKAAIEALNLTIDDAYAIGDGHNDVEILEFVGHGIAMGNGVDEIKEVADTITQSVKGEGVYNAFKDMVWLR